MAKKASERAISSAEKPVVGTKDWNICQIPFSNFSWVERTSLKRFLPLAVLPSEDKAAYPTSVRAWVKMGWSVYGPSKSPIAVKVPFTIRVSNASPFNLPVLTSSNIAAKGAFIVS